MKKEFLADVLATLSRCFVVLIVIVLVGIACSGIRVVKSGEVALVLRFGKLVGDTAEEQIHKPGLLFCFPYFIDEVVTVPIDSVMQQTVTTHYSDSEIVNRHTCGYVITGDQNIAVISASVKYVISDPVAYTLNVSDASALMNAFVSSAMVEEAAKISVDELLTSGKDAFATAVMRLAQDKMAAINAGIMISVVELTNVSMPNEVRATYENVNAAVVQAATQIEQAQTYRENLLPSALAEKASMIAAANSQKATSISAANTDLAEFWGVADEFLLNPELVKTRIYNAKISLAIERIGKVYMVRDDGSKIIITPPQ